MKNPNKYIREAFVEALKATGFSCWAKVVPRTVKPVPKLYVLVTSQNKNTTAVDKDGFEWNCNIVVDITSTAEAGYSEPEVLDNAEEKVLNAINEDMLISPFIIKELTLFDSSDIDSITINNTINRRVMTFELWVNNVD